jgi:hypothetical protein
LERETPFFGTRVSRFLSKEAVTKSQASNREAVEVIEVSNGDFTDKR